MLEKLPFPYFGGKSRVSGEVWGRFGDVRNYVEPFAGGLGMLLNRPKDHEGFIETINDKWAFISNFWRAAKADPLGVAKYADNPVNEIDLTSRHTWLRGRAEALEFAMLNDADYYDAKVAGWWCWGQSCWIGGGWCTTARRQIFRANNGGVNRHRASTRKPSTVSRGVCRGTVTKRPTSEGKGVCRRGVKGKSDDLREYFRHLSDRLRRVRVCCGDWKRVCTPAVTTRFGMTGVFLDPPYGPDAKRDPNIYAKESTTVAGEVFDWAIKNQDNPKLRIAVCGMAGEHHFPDTWETLAWKNSGGKTSRRNEERIWFSPSCMAA